MNRTNKTEAYHTNTIYLIKLPQSYPRIYIKSNTADFSQIYDNVTRNNILTRRLKRNLIVSLIHSRLFLLN